MEDVNLEKRDTSYLVPDAIPDTCCLKLEYLNVWNETAIAARLRVIVWIARDNMSTWNGCMQAQNLNAYSFSKVQKFNQCKILWEYQV